MESSKRRAEAFVRGTRVVDGAGFFWPSGSGTMASRLMLVWHPVTRALDLTQGLADENYAATYEVAHRWTAR